MTDENRAPEQAENDEAKADDVDVKDLDVAARRMRLKGGVKGYGKVGKYSGSTELSADLQQTELTQSDVLQ